MIYRPAAFAVDDRERLVSFIGKHPFASLITQSPDGPWVSHVPLLWRDGQLIGHLARANPQAATLDGGQALAVFHGPHAYVSPRWYHTAPAVPTWNYAVAQARGPARLLSENETEAALACLAAAYEPGPDWAFADLAEDYRAGMQRGIVGFAITVASLEGKFKLSQNRSADDRHAVAEHLSQGGADDRAVAALMTEDR
ncbi:MAG TPA: FMN-binding negative transcriptional regulator [Patescibacteria group bacterium]|nr:FMN-binding negative transcriptional regulator [Patescibacteria group bacterium]